MTEEDDILLKTYMQGFRDELSISHTFLDDKNKLLKKAYELGRVDAIIGDDVMSLDYQTNDDILKRIKSETTL